MYVTQIVTIRLCGAAADKLPHRLYLSTQEWLTQWTPRANFKAVITDTQAEGVEKCRGMLRENLVPSWLDVPPHLFEFELSSQKVDEDMGFWMPSVAVWAHWHPVVEQP